MTEETNQAAATADTTTAAVAAPVEKKTRTVDTRPLIERLTEKYNAQKAKYEALTASLTELVGEINAIGLLASVTVGSNVVINLGKGETRTSVTGIVIGVKDDEEGAKLYKVSYGTGFDADVKIVKASGISLPAAPAVTPEAQAQA